MKSSLHWLLVPALLSATLALAQAPVTDATTDLATATSAASGEKLRYTDDYRISVDDDANSSGEIVFRVTPKDGTPTDVKVAIEKGTNENAIAQAIKKAFVAQIGTKDYNIEMEDGENVIIERSMGAKNISLVLVSSTVDNVTVKVHRD